MEESILIRGARVHNLKNVSLAIPHNLLTVVTGVSGSGKSSLVFDTVYAEGQRRYVESLSAYARQFLERMEKPDVDEISGIAPPIAIRQKNTTRNPRSTVATSTEIYDYLRLLYARAGRSYCPKCGDQVVRDTVDQVAKKMLDQPSGSRWYALVSSPRGRRNGRAARSSFRAAQEGLQPSVSERARFRIFHARVAAGYRFRPAAVYFGGSIRYRARSAPAHRRHHRDLLPRSRRSNFRGSYAAESADSDPAFQREVRLQALRH